MHRLVMNNPAGIPKYLLQEPGWREDEKKAYWSEYGKLLREFKDTKTYLFEYG